MADTARELGVCVRTVRHWDRGRCRVPWSAVRLLRLMRSGDLGALSAPWTGWRLDGRTLWTPEGKPIHAHESAWWSLLVLQARAFREARFGAPQAQAQPVRAGDPAPEAPASLGPAPRPEASRPPEGHPAEPLWQPQAGVPAAAGGRLASPAPDGSAAPEQGRSPGLVPSTTSHTPTRKPSNGAGSGEAAPEHRPPLPGPAFGRPGAPGAVGPSQPPPQQGASPGGAP